MTMRFRLSRTTVQWLGLVIGPLLALTTYFLLPESYLDTRSQTVELSHEARATAAIAVLMASWWLSEAIHVSVTALLPLALFPLVQVSSIREAAAPYAQDLIFLFMGGFILALSMERWGLHRRIALRVLLLVGNNSYNIIGAFMLMTAVMSMWVSNTATAIMMLPIAISVIDLVLKRESGETLSDSGALPDARGRHFALCLMLGIAYSAAIGGIGTLIGTPPNLFLASYIREAYDQEISFATWLGVGLPIVCIFLPLTWYVLTRWIYPIEITRVEGGRELFAKNYAMLDRMRAGEWATLIVFLLTAILWLTRPLLADIEMSGIRPFAGLSDAGIAIIGAILLFLIPISRETREFVMDWDTARNLPWGILILFGGGLSLAAAIQSSGIDQYLGVQVAAFQGLPIVFMTLGLVSLVIFLTELTSNTATTATLVPILAGIAPGLGMHPYMLIVPAAIAASCAFMMPVASPPNAIVFGSGYITIPQMARAGILLNIFGVILVTALTYLAILPWLGVSF